MKQFVFLPCVLYETTVISENSRNVIMFKRNGNETRELMFYFLADKTNRVNQLCLCLLNND